MSAFPCSSSSSDNFRDEDIPAGEEFSDDLNDGDEEASEASSSESRGGAVDIAFNFA